jgi:hypothetical protein
MARPSSDSAGALLRSEAPNTGTLICTAKGQYFAQFSIGAKQPKGTLLRTCTTEEDAKRRQLAIAKLIARLRESGHVAVIPTTIKEAGLADEEEFRKLAKVVEPIAAGKEPGLPSPKTGRRADITVEQLAKLWTSGQLADQYPDHVRVKSSSDTDAAKLTWLGKVRLPDATTFGSRAVAAVSLDDCDHVMGALPKGAEASALSAVHRRSSRLSKSSAMRRMGSWRGMAANIAIH